MDVLTGLSSSEEVGSLRDAHSADLVQLIGENGSRMEHIREETGLRSWFDMPLLFETFGRVAAKHPWLIRHRSSQALIASP